MKAIGCVMILETEEKFGYDPRSLSTGSNKLVVVRCPDCSETRNIALHALLITLHGGRCRACAQSCKFGRKTISSENFPKNVLVRETIEQYGYDPTKLSKGSNRPVITVCVDCGKQRSSPLRCVARQCKDCFAATARRDTKRVESQRTAHLNKSPTITLTTELAVALAYTGMVFDMGKSKLRIVKSIDNIFYRLNGKTHYVNRYNSEFLFKALGVSNRNTQELKAKAADWVLNSATARQSVFKILCYTTRNFRQIIVNDRQRVTFNDKLKFLHKLLDRLGFLYHETKGSTTVTYGSFYINDRWVHVGEKDPQNKLKFFLESADKEVVS